MKIFYKLLLLASFARLHGATNPESAPVSQVKTLEELCIKTIVKYRIDSKTQPSFLQRRIAKEEARYLDYEKEREVRRKALLENFNNRNVFIADPDRALREINDTFPILNTEYNTPGRSCCKRCLLCASTYKFTPFHIAQAAAACSYAAMVLGSAGGTISGGITIMCPNTPFCLTCFINSLFLTGAGFVCGGAVVTTCLGSNSCHENLSMFCTQKCYDYATSSDGPQPPQPIVIQDFLNTEDTNESNEEQNNN